MFFGFLLHHEHCFRFTPLRATSTNIELAPESMHITLALGEH